MAHTEVERFTLNVNDSQVPTLHEALWNLTVENLRYRLKFLVPSSKVTRKAEFVDGIKAALEGPGLLAALNELDEIGRSVVMEAVHDDNNRHSPLKFCSKYGCDAEFFVKHKDSYGSPSYQTPAYRI